MVNVESHEAKVRGYCRSQSDPHVLILFWTFIYTIVINFINVVEYRLGLNLGSTTYSV